MPQSPCFRSKKVLPCSLLLQTLTGERCMQTTSWGGRWSRWSLGRLPPRSTELQPSPCLCSRARKVLHLLRCALAAPGSSFQWSKSLPSYLRMQRQTRVRAEFDDSFKLGVQVTALESLGQGRGEWPGGESGAIGSLKTQQVHVIPLISESQFPTQVCFWARIQAVLWNIKNPKTIHSTRIGVGGQGLESRCQCLLDADLGKL